MSCTAGLNLCYFLRIPTASEALKVNVHEKINLLTETFSGLRGVGEHYLPGLAADSHSNRVSKVWKSTIQITRASS